MKKIIASILAVSLFSIINAQNILPNTGFEAWNVNPNYDDPQGWGTINGLTYILGVRTVTKATLAADIHGGSFAIKLESKNVPFQGTAPGIAATGVINTSGFIDGGLVYTRRPISMSGWYKYTPGGTDTASVEATLSKWVGNTQVEVGKALFTRNLTQSTYAQFTVNFTYTSALTPDTLVVILLTSSQGNNAPTGSKLWIDDLDLQLCTNFATTASNTPSTCTASNGSVTANITAGTGTLTYSWSGGGSTATVAKPAGTYTVTVTDANACTVTASTTVTASNTAITSTPASTPATCTATNGSASVTATNGTPSYTYLWSNNATTASLSNVAAAAYTVTITDANGCSGTAAATVTANTISLTSTPTSTPSTCTAANGSASVTATNGTPSYTYIWSNNATTASLSNVASAAYTVTITDANGCSGTAATTVIANTISLTSTISATATTCGATTGTATVNPTNGTANYTYLWNNSDNTATITNLGAGNYQVTITDANGCSGTATIAVTTPNGPSATQIATDVTCNGEANGAIDVTTTGGTGAISYQWNQSDTTQDLTAISGGTYTLTITDINNCSFTVSAVVNEPTALMASESHTDLKCNGDLTGSIDITVTGGTISYNYLWNNTVTTEDLTNIPAGNDTLVITDANNCTTQIIVTVTEPAVLAVALIPTNATSSSATDGAVNATITGGTSTYTYNWTNASSSEDLSAVGTGNYCITITDNNQCTVTACATVSAPSAINKLSAQIFTLYPNPVAQALTINLSTTLGNNEQIQIFNSIGVLIMEEKATQTMQINLAYLPSGIYLVRLKNNQHSLSFIKQ